MKKRKCSYLFLIIVLGACSAPTSKESQETYVRPIFDERAEAEIQEKTREPVVAEGQGLLQKVAGEYFALSNGAQGSYYQEPCGYSMPTVQVGEIYEETGFWEIYWAGDSYTIVSATQDGNDIRISTSSNVEEMFWFLHNPKKKVWNFGSGRKEAPEIIRVEDIESVEIRPCTDATEILKHLPTSWYALKKVHGKEVIEVPCESAPSGMDLVSNGEFIDFRSGSDPNQIVSISKYNSRISIVHRSVYGGGPDTLVIHNKYGGVAQIGTGSKTDTRYVSEGSKYLYETIEEPCE